MRGQGQGRGKARLDDAPAVLGRNAERRDQVWQRASRLLGVHELEGLSQLDWCEGVSETERALATGWADEVWRRVTDAGDPERLSTALTWLERMLARTRPIPRSSGALW